MADNPPSSYAARLEVDYPDQLDRLTTVLRVIWIIPIGVIAGLFRFQGRVGAYVALLTDRYPSTVDQQAVHLNIDYPDVERDLKRWLPLVKWFLAIPHVVMLLFLGLVERLAVVAAWFAILLTGRYPRGLFDFVVGVWRWALRVTAYAFLLVTDRYPPFSLRGGR